MSSFQPLVSIHICSDYSLVHRVQKMLLWQAIQGKSLTMSLLTVISPWRWMKEATTVTVRAKVMKGTTLWVGPMSHNFQMQPYQETSVRRLVPTNQLVCSSSSSIISHRPSSIISHDVSSSVIIFIVPHLPSSIYTTHLLFVGNALHS